MIMNEDVRWRQRFDNYLKALRLLKLCVPESQADLSEKDQLALIQAFEIIEQLSWKLIKDYLKYHGDVSLYSPKKVVREAFNKKIIPNGQVLVDAIEARNLTSHVYDEDTAKQLADEILHKFLPAFDGLAKQFAQYYAQDPIE